MRKTDKDSLIDRRILNIHKVIAEKLRSQPELLEIVIEKLEHRYAVGLIRHGSYINWCSVLDHKDDMYRLTALLCEDSFLMKKLRRQSPFVGLLTEEEREKAFALL